MEIYRRPRDRWDAQGRYCTQCHLYQRWDNYSRTVKGINGYSPNCKTCKRDYRKRIKQEVVTHYGGACACCGIQDLIFLTVDHVDEDGAAHRREVGYDRGGGMPIYHWLRKNKFPTGFQMLCWNCNVAKHFGDGTCEPHAKYLGSSKK